MAASGFSRVMFAASRRSVWGSLRTGHSGRRAKGLAVQGVLYRPSVCVTSRLLCSKVVEAPVYDDPAAEKAYREAEYKLNRNIFGRMWDWFTAYDEEEPEMPQHEMEERADLLKRVEAMYSADPPIHPDLEFFREAFHLLVKYKDRVGCITLLKLMKETGVEADEDLKAFVDPFLEKAQRESWD